MSKEPLQLLCTGDVHLGRRPSRVPVENDKLSVRRVWDRFVETALNREVDAAVLTGDIVDSENEMYEAYGALSAVFRTSSRGASRSWPSPETTTTALFPASPEASIWMVSTCSARAAPGTRSS